MKSTFAILLTVFLLSACQADQNSTNPSSATLSAAPSLTTASSDLPSTPSELDQFTQIRLQIPYEGLQSSPPDSYGVRMDDTALALYRYLSCLALWNDEFSTIEERNHDNNIYALTSITKSYGPDVNSSAEIVSLLEPLTQSTSETFGFPEGMLWLKEHIEASAQLLYGEKYQMNHGSTSIKYRWLEKEGVYTPPHMGGGGRHLAFVVDYEETETQYIAEIVLISEGMGGLYDPDHQVDISEAELAEYIKTKGVRRIATVNKSEEGALYIASCLRK